MSEDRLIIGYDRGNGESKSALCVVRQNGDVSTIINEMVGSEANTIYAILIGILRLNKEIGYYFSLSDKNIGDCNDKKDN